MTPSIQARLARAPWIQVLWSGFLVFGLLAGAEYALRIPRIFDLLPLPRPYYTYDVSRRLQHLERLLDERGRLDVLFIGSSVVRADISPTVFDAVASQKIGHPVVSFNGGFSKMYPTGAVLYVENLWLPRTRPRLIIHGVREAELASQQHAPYYLKHGRLESLWMSDDPWDRLEAKLVGTVHLLQYRGALAKIVSRLADGGAVNVRERGEMVTDARGYRTEPGSLTRSRGRGKRNWRYDSPPKPGRYGRGFPAIEHIHALCKKAGIQYVLVHLPEHPTRFETSVGPAVWTDYKDRIRAFAAQHDIPYVDVTDGDLSVFGHARFFSDFHHMRPEGTKLFSTMLAERIVERLAAMDRAKH